MRRVRSSLAALLLVGACGTDIQSGIDSANDLLYRKQYVASELLYRKLLKRIEEQGADLSDSEEAERLVVLDRLGKVNALYLNDYEAAIKYYQQLVRLYPRSDQALAALAMMADVFQHKLGNVQAAIDAHQRAVELFPDHSETRRAQLKIANAYFQQKNYEQARTEAETLINRWPDGAEAAQARFQIANSYYLQSRYAEAIATYERLIETKPDKELMALVLFELGNCFQETDEMERALAYYYASLADHPDPMLVQRKIKRVRKRIDKTKPAAGIHLPAYVEERLAAMKTLPFGVKMGSTRPRAAEAPQVGVEPSRALPQVAPEAPVLSSDGVAAPQKAKRKAKVPVEPPDGESSPSPAPVPAPTPAPEAEPEPSTPPAGDEP